MSKLHIWWIQNQLRITISQNTCSWTKAIKFKGNQTISSFAGVCPTYCIIKVQSMISYNNITLTLVREVRTLLLVFFPANRTTGMKIQVQMGQNQGTKTGSMNFILSALKWQSWLIQKTQERKRTLEGQTLVICAIMKEILKHLIHLQHLTLNSKRQRISPDMSSHLSGKWEQSLSQQNLTLSPGH